jgi:alkanesulfonate monooxygenase SsuD/methylene tetrahydromethanopterin reductase-like flavin-dependent oxidoreductase (luciferase family)
VASLDLLSGGRVELGLGGGGFWDAIEAMGGPRRSPRETVEALSEAIDVIHAMWAEERGGVFFDGKHYHVHGAKRGPAPAHNISIWIGAYGPRMLRLIGEKADGWLPSLSYMQPGDLERGNRIIDEAAQAAGRDPRKIRRLLNFSPGDLNDGRLFEFGLENGVSAFILWADDSDSIAQFGELAQKVREAVAK